MKWIQEGLYQIYLKFDNSKLRQSLLENQEKILLILFLSGISGLIVQKTGLINYMPEKIKNTFIRRSIFDILMDLWYLPTISEYLKLLIKPVLYKLSPEEATKVLEDFDPQIRKIFLTKGIIKLLPQKVKNVLMPTEVVQSYTTISSCNLPAEENHSDSTREDQHPAMEKESEVSKEKGIVLYKQPNFKSKKYQRKKNRKDSTGSSISAVNDKDKSDNFPHALNGSDEQNNLNSLNPLHLNEEFEKEIPIHSDEAEFTKFTNKQILPLVKNSEIYDKKINEPQPQHQHERQASPISGQVKIPPNEDFRFYEIDDDKGGKQLLKTVVITSTEKMKKIDRVESNLSMKDLKEFCWDNLEEYKLREAKKSLKSDDHNSKSNFFQMFTKSIHQHLLNKIDYNKLSKAFIIFLLTFAVQMIISKRARRWSITFLQFVVYLTTSLGAGGTLYFLLKKKAIKNS